MQISGGEERALQISGSDVSVGSSIYKPRVQERFLGQRYKIEIILDDIENFKTRDYLQGLSVLREDTEKQAM